MKWLPTSAILFLTAFAAAQPDVGAGPAFASAAAPATAAAGSSLETGFAKPPLQARPLVWWHWINGNVTKEGIRADLEDMKRVGIGGAQILDVEMYLPKGPVRYGTDEWHEHVQYAIETAAELGLEIDIANSPGWSGSGGPWVTPERAMKKIVWSEMETDGGAVSLELPQPPAKLGFYRDIALLAVPPTAERLDELPPKIVEASKPVFHATGSGPPGILPHKVLDLTAKMDGAGKLSARLPPGRWVLLRFGYSATGATNHPAQPEGHGLEVNKLDAEAVAFEFEQSLARIIRDAGPLAGRTLNGILFDSFEAGFQNWTASFPAEFAKRKGYDFITYLPLVTGRIIQSREVSQAVLWDFRHVIDELFAENYFGTMHRLAAKHGMKIYSESQGGPLNPMSANRHVDVPMNEFWVPDTTGRASRIKLTTSAAAFLGRNIIAAEAFTATPANGKYQNTPSTLKRPGDQAFALGINRFVFHHYTHQPVTAAAPGFALGRYGSHFGRLNTWWPYADAWIRYLARCQFLLQQGHTVADACVLVEEDTGYGFPSKMANIVPGYDFNACSPADLRAMSFRDGRLVHPQGQSYGLLILPREWVAELSTMRHCRKLVQAGAAILGEPPMAPAGLRDVQAREEFDRLVAELWSGVDGKKVQSKQVAAATVYRGLEPTDVLQQRGLAPDLSCASADADFEFIHRETDEADIYFIFSDSEEPVCVDLRFRQKDRRPEIWDAVTGTYADAPIFAASAEGVTVPIQFEPWGSVFVIFRKPLPNRWITAAAPTNLELRNGTILAAGQSAVVSFSDGGTQTVSLAACPAALTLQRSWEVSFVDRRGAPSRTVFEKLISWPKHSDPGIKHYSGAAVYRTTFDATAALPGRIAILDLGEVANIAKVSVNGRSAGVLWKPPFRADVTRLLCNGSNTLEVHVANRWINRLIGDEAVPVDYTYQRPGRSKFTDGRLLTLPVWLYDPSKLSTRKRHSFSTWKHYGADSSLVPSGLIGPVKLEWFERLSAADVSVPAVRTEQTGMVPEGATQPEMIVLANEPEGSKAGMALDFDFESVPYSETPLARLQLGSFEKIAVKRPNQKNSGERGALHVFIYGTPGQEPTLAGSAPMKPGGRLASYTIDVTRAVNEALASPPGRRSLRLVVRLTGKPLYYEVYGVPKGPDKTVPTVDIASPAGWIDDWEQRVAPITSGPIVYRESCLPLAENRDQELTFQLLYPARKIIEVIHNGTGEKLKMDRDWLLRDGKLVLPPGSHAPVQLESEFFSYPRKEKDGTVRMVRSRIRLVEGTWYHQRQMEVAYEPSDRDWMWPAPLSTIDQLPRLKKRLAEKAPVSVILFGDSIAIGGNASKFQGCWPYQPSFGELVVRELEQHYGIKITFMNHSRAGATSSYAVTQVDSQVGSFEPDLAIIAYGMNDRAEGRRESHRANIEKIIDTVRKRSPETEFVIVTPMLNNPKQPTGLDPVLFIRDEALKVSRPGVAYVDMTRTNLELLRRKSYLDLSGNGANHPNDFLHRIYAQRILEVLVPSRSKTHE